MEALKIDATQLTRQIRERDAEHMQTMTREQKIAYCRTRAKAAYQRFLASHPEVALAPLKTTDR